MANKKILLLVQSTHKKTQPSNSGRMKPPNLLSLFFYLVLLSPLAETLEDSSNIVVDQYQYEAPEMYEYLNGNCDDCNPAVPESPDPLVSMTWDSTTNTSQLQIYRVDSPVSYEVQPPGAIQGIETLFHNDRSDSDYDTNAKSRFRGITISQNCTLLMDWGVERAAWFELTSSNTNLHNSTTFRVQASISEFNAPYPGKTTTMTKYGSHTYRLETNPQLYEGIRYTFLRFEFFPTSSDTDTDTTLTPIHIAGMSLVAKIKPIPYTGSFWSSDSELTRAWYTGAYGVRVNMEENDFNSILIERGDRVAIQGDGHPTIDAALVAFSPYEMVKDVLLQTDSAHKTVVDDNIMAYPLYWCLSAIDYFMESGDIDTFRHVLVSDISTILDRRIEDFLDPNLDITWFGWDDRLGSGWCFHSKDDVCTREALLAFAGLLIRTCKDFAHALQLAHMPTNAQTYWRAYQSMSARLQQVPEWIQGFGVHAAANAINAGVANPEETEHWMDTVLNNAVTICSFSQFNQYWILQAFGNADRMEHAIASIKLCWGPMMKLGKGCFWEVSSPEWLTFMKEGDQAPHLPSYCHPWASGVTPWMSHILGGLEPTLPGYKEFSALPYISMKYRSVRTSITTPMGKITVNATLSNDFDTTTPVGDDSIFSFVSYVDSPVPGVFGIRTKLKDSTGDTGAMLDESTMLANGSPVNILSLGAVEHILGRGQALKHRNVIFFRLLGPGEHCITATYRYNSDKVAINGKRRQLQISDYSPFPPSHYPASVLEMDKTSRGDGLFTHGSDGYMLIGCDENGNDIWNLPSYVSNITMRRHGFPGWLELDREMVGTSDSNPVYLPLSKSDTHSINYNNGTTTNIRAGKRALGRVGIDGVDGGDINCIIVDITVANPPRPFQLSAYLVAKTSENRHAVRVMDAETLNVIAPTTMISDYEGGVWWTVQYHKSIRLRFLDILGIQISALAFTTTTTTMHNEELLLPLR